MEPAKYDVPIIQVAATKLLPTGINGNLSALCMNIGFQAGNDHISRGEREDLLQNLIALANNLDAAAVADPRFLQNAKTCLNNIGTLTRGVNSDNIEYQLHDAIENISTEIGHAFPQWRNISAAPECVEGVNIPNFPVIGKSDTYKILARDAGLLIPPPSLPQYPNTEPLISDLQRRLRKYARSQDIKESPTPEEIIRAGKATEALAETLSHASDQGEINAALAKFNRDTKSIKHDGLAYATGHLSEAVLRDLEIHAIKNDPGHAASGAHGVHNPKIRTPEEPPHH